jgi:phosphoribosylanthranilate isomerase
MSFIIKICGITNERDALAAVEAGANALGFNFYPRSPRFITLETAQCIAGRLPDTVLKVGVFVEPSEEELKVAIDQVPLDVVQLHGKRVPSAAHRTWRALSATQADPAESLVAEAILLDSHTPYHGGSGQTFDWKLASRFWQPIILAGGLDSTNVAAAIEVARPWGVDACSRLETAPGIKDPIRVRSFVQAARLAADSLLPESRLAAVGSVPQIRS